MTTPTNGSEIKHPQAKEAPDKATGVAGELTRALRLAELGYRVLPVHPDSKKPLIRKWPQNASTDPARIRGWWQQHPMARPGIAAGDGLAVVDLDVKGGTDGVSEFRQVTDMLGVPWDPTTQTASGGQHVYFRTDDTFGNRTGVLPGVDVRSAGGYVVAYELPPALAALPPLPAAVAGMLRGAGTKTEAPTPGPATERVVGPAAVQEALQRELARVGSAPAGTRNDTLNGAAFNLGQLVGPEPPHLDEDDVRARLLAAAEAGGLNAREAAGTVESGLAAGKADPRTVVADPPVAEPPTGAWTPVDLRPILAGDRQPLKPTLLQRDDGLCLLYQGRTHSISGESGSGKSWVVQWAAATVLQAGGRVLILDYEASGEEVVDRLRALGCSDRQLLEGLHYLNPEAAPTGAEFEALLATQYDLAVVDGVTEALNMSGIAGDSLTNNNDAVTRWHAMLPKRIATVTGAAVVQVDHVTKAKDSRAGHAIGGQAKRSAITGAAYVVEPMEPFGRGRSGTLQLYLARKDRPGFVRGRLGPEEALGQLVGTVCLDSQEDGAVVRLTLTAPPAAGPAATKADRLAPVMVRVSEFLREQGSTGASIRKVRDHVSGQTRDKDEALRRLVDQGYAERVSGSRGALLHHFVRPYIPELEGDVDD